MNLCIYVSLSKYVTIYPILVGWTKGTRSCLDLWSIRTHSHTQHILILWQWTSTPSPLLTYRCPVPTFNSTAILSNASVYTLKIHPRLHFSLHHWVSPWHQWQPNSTTHWSCSVVCGQTTSNWVLWYDLMTAGNSTNYWLTSFPIINYYLIINYSLKSFPIINHYLHRCCVVIPL